MRGHSDLPGKGRKMRSCGWLGVCGYENLREQVVGDGWRRRVLKEMTGKGEHFRVR